jgi:hypothetical protein
LVLQFFLKLYAKCSVQDFLIARYGFVFFIFEDVYVFCNSN